jgi:hypothetical protein
MSAICSCCSQTRTRRLSIICRVFSAATRAPSPSCSARRRRRGSRAPRTAPAPARTESGDGRSSPVRGSAALGSGRRSRRGRAQPCGASARRRLSTWGHALSKIASPRSRQASVAMSPPSRGSASPRLRSQRSSSPALRELRACASFALAASSQAVRLGGSPSVVASASAATP